MTNRLFSIFVGIITTLGTVSCDMFIFSEPKYVESIVWGFDEYDSAAAFPSENVLYTHKYDISVDYYSQRTVRYDSATDKDWFLSMCDKYRDNHYHGNIADKLVPFYLCVVPDVTAINIISSDDFDVDHPAGTLLNDCFSVYYQTIQNVIDSDYSNTKPEEIKKDLASVDSGDLSMLLFRETGFPWQSLSSEQYGLEDRPDGSVFGLLVTKMPKQNTVQHLTISFTTEYGKIISCPITYDFSQCLLAGKK